MKKVFITTICLFAAAFFFGALGMRIYNRTPMVFGDDAEVEYSIETDENGTKYACVMSVRESSKLKQNVKISDTYKGLPVKRIYGLSSSLSKIFIPDSVEYIDNAVFENDLRIAVYIEVGENNSQYKSIGGNLYSKDGKKLLKCTRSRVFSTTFVVPDEVEIIGQHAFHAMANFGESPASVLPKKIIVGNGVKIIEKRAFDHADYIRYISIGNGITTIEEGTFVWCKNLRSINLGSNITHIGDGAFYYCLKLKDVYIPKSVTQIDEDVFYQCSKLERVYYDGTEDEWNKISVNSKGNDTLTSATVFYYSDIKPNIEGNYWYYDKKGKVQIWK